MSSRIAPHAAPPSQPRRRARLVKRLLLAFAVLIVVLTGIIGLFGPRIAGALAPAIIESAASKAIRGEVKISSVSLSWGGPQKIESLTLVDPDGGTVAELSGEADASLLELAFSGGRLGTISLTGKLDIRAGSPGHTNLEAAVESELPAADIPMPPTGVPAPPRPLTVPKNFDVNLVLNGMEVSYTAPPDASGAQQKFLLKDVNATVQAAAGRPFQFSLSAQPVTFSGQPASPLKITINADKLIDANGNIVPGAGSIVATCDASLPNADLDRLLLGFLPAPPAGDMQPASVAGPAPESEGQAEVHLDVTARNGRLTNTDPARPSMVRFQVPQSLVALIPDSQANLTLTRRPTIELALTELDVPMPTAAGQDFMSLDWRNATARIILSGTETAGTVIPPVADPGASPRPAPFHIEPFNLAVGTANFSDGVGIFGSLTGTYDGKPFGTVVLDLCALGILSDAGALRPEDPRQIRGRLVFDGLPTALLQPFADPHDIDLAQVFGPAIAADCRLGRVAPGAVPAANIASVAPAGQTSRSDQLQESLESSSDPYFAATIKSELTHAWIDLYIATGSIRVRNKGITVESEAAGYLVRRFAPRSDDRPIDIRGQGRAMAYVQQLEIPLNGNKPDLAQASADVRLVVGELEVVPGPGADPVALESLDSQVRLSPGPLLTAGIDYRFAYQGRKSRAFGSFELPGLMVADAGAELGVSFNAKSVRPVGKLEVSAVPTSLAGLASSDAAKVAEAVFGPTIALTVAAASSAAQDGPPELVIDVDSPGCTASGVIAFDDARIVTGDEGISVVVQRPADVLNTLNPPPQDPSAPRASFAGDQPVSLTVTGLVVPLPGAGSPGGASPLPAATISLSVPALEAGFTDPGASGAEARAERLSISDLTAQASLTPDGSAGVQVNGVVAHGDERSNISGRIGLAKLFSGDYSIDLTRTEPSGKLVAEHVPVSLVAFISPEHAALARDVVGESATLSISAAPSPRKDGRLFDIRLESPRLAAQSAVSATAGLISIGPTHADATVTPGAVAGIARHFATPDNPVEKWPVLDADAKLRCTAAPVDLAFNDPQGLKQFSIRRPIRAQVTSDSDIQVSNLPGPDPEKRLALGVRALEIGGVINTFNERESEGSLKAVLFDPVEPAATVLRVEVTSGLAPGGAPIQASIREADTPRLDRILGRPDMLAGALGASFSLIVTSGKPQPEAATVIAAELHSPRLKTSARFQQRETLYALASPMTVQWNIDRTFAERYLLGQDASATARPAAQPPTLRVTEDVPVTLHIDQLAFRADATPLDPAVFRLESRLAAPVVALETASGTPIRLDNLQAQVRSTTQAGAIDFMLWTPAPGPAGQGAQPPRLIDVSGNVVNLADSAGTLTPDAASITLSAKGDLPTPLVDALARQDGKLVDLLGPRMQTDIRLADFSKSSGSVRADLKAQHAEAHIAGDANARSVLITTGRPEVRLTRITPEFSRRFISTIIPIFEQFEKTSGDEPSVITASSLELPLDNDLTKLNGTVTVDLGTVTFKTSSLLGAVLEATRNKAAGRIGQKVDPFTFTITRGVVNYEKITIPTGEFIVQTRGTIDLPARKLDIVVLMPLYALADEAAKLFGGIPGIDRLTMVPLRIRGSMDDPRTELDPALLIQEGLPGAVKDGLDELLKKGIGEIFKNKK